MMSQQEESSPRTERKSSAMMKKLRLHIDTDDPQYPTLRKLKVRGKALNDLPAELFMLEELEVLDLSPEREACIDYNLRVLSPAIGDLVNLRVLVLDTNELTTLPAELGYLSRLERLSLSNNKLSHLPYSLHSLARLESLHLANNKFTEFPEAICRMRALRFLDLSDNLLSALPEEISSLWNLESLILSYNRLSVLPDAICDLVHLHVLWIGNNHIRRLPPGFGRLKNLDWGFRHMSSATLDGNPLTHPPPDVCRRGIDAIARFFSSDLDH